MARISYGRSAAESKPSMLLTGHIGQLDWVVMIVLIIVISIIVRNNPSRIKKVEVRKPVLPFT